MNISYEAPARNSYAAPLIGAAVGAVIGVACFATASSINLYSASAVRPAVSTMAAPVAQTYQTSQVATAQFAAPRASMLALCVQIFTASLHLFWSYTMNSLQEAKIVVCAL